MDMYDFDSKNNPEKNRGKLFVTNRINQWLQTDSGRIQRNVLK